MNNKSKFISVIVASFLISYSSFAQSTSDIPTLCKATEFPYLNAQMQKIQYHDKAHQDKGYKLVKTGKILSLCADKNKEPFGKFVYRYGAIGKIEMESVATETYKFNIYEGSTTPHTGENVFFFSKEKYNYYVTEATGQGSGISLTIFNSGKRILDLFSGNDRGSDYESGMLDVDFGKASSPIFEFKEPVDNVD